jgi:AcrR family transcriptional regulator
MNTVPAKRALRPSPRRTDAPRRGRHPIPRLRERILSSASELFGEKGFDHVLTEEVAAHAGVGKGSVYRQFRSKEELYAAAVIEGFIQLRMQIEAALADGGSIPARVTTIVRLAMAYFWTRRQFFVLLHDPASLPRRTEHRYFKEREQLSRLISQVLAEGARAGSVRADLDFALVAESMLGMMRGIQRYKRDGISLDEAIRTVVALFLDGCLTNAVPPRDSR